MARGNGKKQVKFVPPSSSTTQRPNTSNSSSPPSPFEPVPATLSPVTSCLPKHHVVVVHLEKTPSDLRKKAFIVPVVLNVLITLGLCWRLYHAVPAYLEQLTTIFGYETSWTVVTKRLGWGPLLTILARRTIQIILDYAIFGLLGRWPWEFVFGDRYGRYVGSAAWRWNVGFDTQYEAIVRRAGKWDIPLLMSEEQRMTVGKSPAWTTEEELLVYKKCTDASSKLQTNKNALSLLDQDWDLDYKSMVEITHLLEEAKIQPNELESLILLPWQSKWYCWYPHGTTGSDQSHEMPGEKDEKLEDFKRRLTELNCEGVFYRWVEILQYETAQPGGFTSARRKEAEQELRKMIDSRGHDSSIFVQSLGGASNIPGLD